MYEDRPITALETEQVSAPAVLPENPANSSNTADHSQPRHLPGSGTIIHGISSELVLELVEIYFSHITNSALLLHKATFVEQLTNDQSRDHVVLSICALAAK